MTLIDYPGKLAATVFTVGCNFRCHFCHNPELVLTTRNPQPTTQEKEFLSFLKKRRGKLEGVCITGGEPTIQPDLVDFIKKIKKLGFSVKLDTNGARSDVLKKLIDARLIDYIAMDIKNSLEKYPLTVGNLPVDIKRITLSVDLIRNSRLPYEFRTTVVPGIHTKNDFVKIAEWLKGARLYALQKYRPERILNPAFFAKKKKAKLDLGEIKSLIENNFGKVEIRNC